MTNQQQKLLKDTKFYVATCKFVKTPIFYSAWIQEWTDFDRFSINWKWSWYEGDEARDQKSNHLNSVLSGNILLNKYIFIESSYYIYFSLPWLFNIGITLYYSSKRSYHPQLYLKQPWPCACFPTYIWI